MDAFFSFIQDHIFFAVLMFGMSLIAMTLVIWRLLLNYNARSRMNEFWLGLQKKLDEQGVEGALRHCRRSQALIPKKLLAVGLENARNGLGAMRRSMAAAMELEIVPDLNFLLPSILAIAKIATMVGLLGTVISMIGTFEELAEATKKVAQDGQASREIGLALFATALGLMTAIPLVFSHVLFKAWVHRFEIQMKREAQKLITLVQRAQDKTSAESQAPKRSKVTSPI